LTALQQINKKNLSIGMDGRNIPLPAYVSRAASTYFFDAHSRVLKKRCHVCQQFYDVEQLNEGTWQDIHDEREYRKVSSGYSSYCVQCIDEKNSKQSKKGEIIKVTFHLEQEVSRFIKIKATLEGISYSEYITRLVKTDKRATDLKKLL